MDETDTNIIEIIPLDEYDIQKAKAQCSLSWILCKAYEDNVPAEFQDPFYQAGNDSWQIKPRLANLLANSEIYCAACKNIFGENVSQWTGHLSIIQVLSRRGIHAIGSDSVDVTETVLMQSAPFKLKAHLVFIDALMTALSKEIMSIERVTQAVQKFATFNVSSELPSDIEETVLFWVNKVCATVQRQLESAQNHLIEGGESNQKVRIVSSKGSTKHVSVPLMESLTQDMSDGCALATVLSFYCPTILNINDVCLTSGCGIADCLYNLRLIHSFCKHHLTSRIWHFNYEDLLYTFEVMNVNIIMMIAEIYYWFEIHPIPIVTGAGLASTTKHGGDHLSSGGVALHTASISISNVTKQSFQCVKPNSEFYSDGSPDLHKMNPSAPVVPRMPLLYKRQQHNNAHFSDDSSLKDSRPTVHRAGSLTTHDLKSSVGIPKQSIVVWPDKSSRQSQQEAESVQCRTNANLLANVSIDSEMNASFSSSSIDLSDLDTTPRTDKDSSWSAQAQKGNVISFSLAKHGNMSCASDATVAKDMEIESVNSRVYSTDLANDSKIDTSEMSAREKEMEPLMPARLKPAKEKVNSHSKEEEREEVPRRKTPSPPKFKKTVQIDPQLTVGDESESFDEMISALPESQNLSVNLKRENSSYSHKKFEAFFVGGSIRDSQDLLSHRSDITIAESYVVDQIQTPEAARAAGIPIIDDFQSLRHLSRNGSYASSRSSSDYSDHESHKIHSDHKAQETLKAVKNTNDISEAIVDKISDPERSINQKPALISQQLKELDRNVQATNFAQIKQMKQLGQVDHSSLVYMQHGQDETRQLSLKDTFQKKQQGKTSVVLPSQRNWQSNAGSSPVTENEANSNNTAGNGTAGNELLKLK